MKFDVQKLTLGEVAFIEDKAGQSMSSFGDDETPRGRMLAAMVTIAKRRGGEPKFRFEDAMAIGMDEAREILGISDDDEDGDDPKDMTD